MTVQQHGLNRPGTCDHPGQNAKRQTPQGVNCCNRQQHACRQLKRRPCVPGMRLYRTRCPNSRGSCLRTRPCSHRRVTRHRCSRCVRPSGPDLIDECHRAHVLLQPDTFGTAAKTIATSHVANIKTLAASGCSPDHRKLLDRQHLLLEKNKMVCSPLMLRTASPDRLS